jgi:hypothetical protein
MNLLGKSGARGRDPAGVPDGLIRDGLIDTALACGAGKEVSARLFPLLSRCTQIADFEQEGSLCCTLIMANDGLTALKSRTNRLPRRLQLKAGRFSSGTLLYLNHGRSSAGSLSAV